MADKTTTQKSAGSPPKGAGAGKRNGISKKEAVRLVLEKLGRDAKPAQLRPYIKATFGLDMTPAHITTAKGELLRGKGGKGKAAKGKKTAPNLPTQAAAPAPPAQPPPKAQAAGSRSGGSISLADIQAVQGLLGRVGADTLHGLIDVLAK
jgi:hypothetical protein